MIAVHSAREGGAFEAPAEIRKSSSLTGPERKPQREAATARKEVLGTCLRILLVTFGALVFFFLVLAFLRPRPRPGGKQGESELEPEEESGELEPLTAYLDLDMGSPRDRVIAEYVRLQESLKLTRSQRRPHQTPLEHARAVTRGRQELEEAFLQLHRVLYRAIYANDPVEDHHLATFLRSCRRVRKILV